jgi:hypothetical protein
MANAKNVYGIRKPKVTRVVSPVAKPATPFQAGKRFGKMVNSIANYKVLVPFYGGGLGELAELVLTGLETPAFIPMPPSEAEKAARAVAAPLSSRNYVPYVVGAVALGGAYYFFIMRKRK